jgi:lipid-binding SYLF domain-containing protein
MQRALVAALLALTPLFMASAARAQTEQQTLVDRATLSIQDILIDNPARDDAKTLLRRSKGAMICPRVFKAGFFFGGQGGGCVLVGHGPTGWSPPAFYGMGSGSFGLQAGIQDSEVLMIVLTDKGLHALLDSQVKIGGDASLAFATVGLGIQGATTAAFNADIVAYQNNRGLFAGISLDGGMISARTDWNQIYYGQPLAGQQIVLQGQGNNPGADPLREVLAHYSAPLAPTPMAALQPPASPMPGAPPQGGYSTASPGAPLALTPTPQGRGVQSAPLPPPAPR